MPGEQKKAKAEAAVYGAELSLQRSGKTASGDEVATTSQLFGHFVLAMESGWRSATGTTNRARWRLWEAFFKPETPPDLVTEDILDAFHARLRMTKASPNQVRQIFKLLRSVYSLGLRRHWITGSAPLTYKLRLAKNEVAHDPKEYSPAEWLRLLDQIDGTSFHHWRLRVAVLLAGSQGARISSIRHLRWADVQLSEGAIVWPAIYMKQGREFAQPMTAAAREALELAARWRTQLGYTGPWVLPAARIGDDVEPVSYPTLNYALREAEKSAGIEHTYLTGFHALRRMAAENVYEQTGDLLAAAAWIGDRDIKQLKSYLKRKEPRMARAAEAAGTATADAVNRTLNRTQETDDVGEGALLSEPLVRFELTTATVKAKAETPQNPSTSSHSNGENPLSGTETVP